MSKKPVPSTLAKFQAYLPQEHQHLFQWKDGHVSLNCDEIGETMYGCAGELSTNAWNFADFPGSHNHFGCELTDSINNEINVMTTSEEEPFIYKQDAFIRLFQILEKLEENPEIRAMMSWFIRSKENQMKGICELMSYQKEVFEEFMENLKFKLSNFSCDTKLEKATLECVFQKVKGLLPANELDKDYDAIRKVLLELCKKKLVKKNVSLYENLISKTAFFVEEFEMFMTEHRAWFNPKPLDINSREHTGPPIVRVFKIGKIVMLSQELLIEVYKADLDTEQAEHEVSSMTGLDTVDCDEVCGQIEQIRKDIKYVFVPIYRVNFRAPYIPTIDGRHFTPAADAVLEILHHLIAVKMVFQHLEKEKTLQICELFTRHVLQKWKKADFVFIEEVSTMKEAIIRELQSKLPKVLSSKKLKIRKASKSAPKLLNDELIFLGLNKAFPEDFQNYENFIFSRTSAMYNRVEEFQRMAVLKNCGELVEFFHKNGMCVRLNIVCPECEDDANRVPMKNVKMILKASDVAPEVPDDQVGQLTEKLGGIDLKPQKAMEAQESAHDPIEVSCDSYAYKFTAMIDSSKSSLHCAFLRFLPEEYHQLVRLVNGVIKIDPALYDIYGSEYELMNAVKKYASFPGSGMFFFGELTDPFFTELKVYESQTGASYTFQHSALISLYKCAEQCTPGKEVLAMISFYVKSKEYKLNGVCNIVPISPQEIDKLLDELMAKLSMIQSSKLDDISFEGVFEKLKEILPSHPDDPEYDSIREILEKSIGKKPIQENVKFYENWIDKTELIVKDLNILIAKHPKWFEPKPNCPLDPKNEGPAVVRLFKDSKESFVFATELRDQLIRSGLGICDIGDKFSEVLVGSTINYEKLPEILGAHRMKHVEFVPSTHLSAVPRCQYIPALNGDYCYPALNLLMDVIFDIVSVKRLFQNSECEALTIIRIIETLCVTTTKEAGGTRFVPVSLILGTNAYISVALEKYVPGVLVRPKLEVKKIGLFGFTEKDIKNELTRLGIVNTFSHIFQVVRYAFQTVNEAKTCLFLRTCDMHKALELCQLYTIMMNSDKIASFIHANHGCRSLFYGCTDCDKEAKKAGSSSDE